MNHTQDDNRKYKRYEQDLKVYFNFPYDLETKVEFELDKAKKTNLKGQKFSGVSLNFSTEGVCFVSAKKLFKGDKLQLDVYLPADNHPIHMEGEVCWSKEHFPSDLPSDSFDTGVLLKTVKGKPVGKSIYYDEKYHVYWSEVLESVLGNFRIIMQKLQNKEKGR